MTADATLPPSRARGPGRRREHVTITVPLETITPILGGAAVPRKLDDHDPIRVPGIRGQLRFFWRALHGHQYESIKDLAAAEAELFGGVHGETPTRSQVAVWITSMDKDTLRKHENNPTREELYALWPAASNNSNKDPSPRWQPGIRFELALRCPVRAREEIEPTLRAWILFGGIGGRTRRGCGSITVRELERKDWLPKEITRAEFDRLLGSSAFAAAPGKASQMPLLHGAELLFGAFQKDGCQSWYEAIKWLRAFRQEPCPQGQAPKKYARDEKREGKRPGRSHWPEPDKIRHLRASDPTHEWQHPPLHNDVPVWPRASFGLPIVGQFQKKDIRGNRYARPEPEDFELRWQDKAGKTQDRLASPLILKALPLASGRYAPIALWLYRAYPDGEVVLLGRGRDSAAQFDQVRARGDEVRYEPLEKATSMQKVFFEWLKATHKLKELSGGGKR